MFSFSLSVLRCLIENGSRIAILAKDNMYVYIYKHIHLAGQVCVYIKKRVIEKCLEITPKVIMEKSTIKISHFALSVSSMELNAPPYKTRGLGGHS